MIIGALLFFLSIWIKLNPLLPFLCWLLELIDYVMLGERRFSSIVSYILSGDCLDFRIGGSLESISIKDEV